MQRFQHAILLFGSLGEQCSRWERTLPADEAKQNISTLFLSVSDSEFEMIGDLLELIETEPGKRLFGEVNTHGLRQHLLEITVQRANARKPEGTNGTPEEHQQQKETRV